MSMWKDEPPGAWGETPEMQGETVVPEGAAFSPNMNGQPPEQMIPDAAVVKGGAYEMALAAFVLAGAALSLALFVYLTREVPK